MESTRINLTTAGFIPRVFFSSSLIALLSFLMVFHAGAQQSFWLEWDPSPTPGVAGYTVRYGTNSGRYSDFLVVGLETTAEVPDLIEGATYYFVVSAYTLAGLESDPSNQISYTVPDGGTPSSPPTLNALPDLSLNEDAPVQTVPLSGISAGLGTLLQPGGISITASSSNPALLPHPTVNYTSPTATGSLRLAPAPNAHGTAVITVTVNNFLPVNNLFSRQFTVSVAPVNDPPTLGTLPDTSLDVSAGAQTIPLSGISSGAPNENQTLTITATSSNPGLIPDPVVTYSSPDAAGSLTINPVDNATGTAIITVTVSDGSSLNRTTTRTFTVNVSASTAAPGFTYYLEAESGALTSPMITAASASASNGRYIYSQSSERGTVTFQLATPAAGDYVIWCRVLSVDNGTDSFYVSVDGGEERIYRTAQNIWSPNWQWTRINDGTSTLPLIFTLNQSLHTFRFRGRESSTLLDALYITNNRDFVPVKLGITRVNSPTPGMALNFQSVAGYKYALEATEDFRSWSSIWSLPTNTTSSQPFSLIDTYRPPSGKRFYRVRINQ